MVDKAKSLKDLPVSDAVAKMMAVMALGNSFYSLLDSLIPQVAGPGMARPAIIMAFGMEMCKTMKARREGEITFSFEKESSDAD